MFRRHNNPRYRWLLLLQIAALVLVVAAMVMLSRCDKAVDGLPVTHSEGDTIDVAIEYSPTTYYSYADTLGGFDHDLLVLVQREAHRPIKFHPVVSLTRALRALDRGIVDIVVAQFPPTSTTRKRYLFTDSLYIDHQVLVQRADRKPHVHTPLDLAGKTVHVVSGSPMAERIEALSEEIGDTINVVVETTYGAEQLAMMVAAGDIDFAVINERVARQMAARLPELDCSVSISMSQFQAWALKSDNVALRDSLNAWIKRLNGTPEYLSLRRRYL